MQNKSDKKFTNIKSGFEKRKNKLVRARSMRRAAFAKARLAMRQQKSLQHKIQKHAEAAKLKNSIAKKGYDPELLYVECGRCGAPVLWEPGRATSLLRQAGVDPIELDSSCILVTDACPACGVTDEYSVRIFRIGSHRATSLPIVHGNA